MAHPVTPNLIKTLTAFFMFGFFFFATMSIENFIGSPFLSLSDDEEELDS